MNYDTIFFDIGNTLCFYHYDFLKGFLEERFGMTLNVAQMEETHLAVQKSVLAQAGALQHRELWDEIYQRWFTKLNLEKEAIPEAIEAIRHHPFRHLFWARMEEGTREMLDWFRERGVRLGVISNAEGQIQRLVDHMGLASRFEIVVDSGVVGMQKPDARIFHYACEQIKAEPARSIHVGDLYDVDVLGARKAGLTPVLVDRNDRAPGVDCLRIKSALSLPSLPIFSGDAPCAKS